MHAHLVQQHVEQHRQTTSLKEANAALRANLNKSTQVFQMRESDLKEQNAHLTLEEQSLKEQVKSLSKERDDQATTIFQHQALIESLKRRIVDQNAHVHRQLILQEELLVWQEQRKEAELAKLRLEEAESALRTLEDELVQASKAADNLEEQLLDVKNEVSDQARQIVQLELEVDQLNQHKSELKSFFEASKEMQQLKLDAQQRKFEAMRDRALLLEEKILHLQSEAEIIEEGKIGAIKQ
jgi:chromosome segregation ATPase